MLAPNSERCSRGTLNRGAKTTTVTSFGDIHCPGGGVRKIFCFYQRFFSIALSNQQLTKYGASFSKEDHGHGLPLITLPRSSSWSRASEELCSTSVGNVACPPAMRTTDRSMKVSSPTLTFTGDPAIPSLITRTPSTSPTNSLRK